MKLNVGLVAALAVGVVIQGKPERPWSDEARNDALRRAIVWQPPAIPIASADLSKTPAGLPDVVRCRFTVDELGGLTPKFLCALPGGEIVKVKYSGAEPYGEVAATRLLRTLGFGADHVDLVRRLRCYGCPRFPFTTLKIVQLLGADRLFERGLDYDNAIDFEWVAVERKQRQDAIETAGGRGWAFHELVRLPTASRTHRDALTLMAVFLAHWDNKAENQRLVCLDRRPRGDGKCSRPLALLQDVGGTFGPRKTDLAGWRNAPVWHDRKTCTVSMSSLPHGGATFVDTAISEGGRRFLADRLTQLRQPQIESLFRGAQFERHDGTVAEWTATFKAKVAAIAEGPRCPS